MAANDKEFLISFSNLLRDSQNLKLDEQVIDNMLKSLFKTNSAGSNKSNSSAQYKVAFIQALLGERKFLINLVRSLLRVVLSAANPRNADKHAAGVASGSSSKPMFQNDSFLEAEFTKLTQARS